MTPVLQAQGVSVRFGGVQALDRVDLALAPGELLGLIGPNGAGKTTLLRVITGVVRPQAGRVRLDGGDLGGLPIARRVQRGLGLSQQLVRPLASMTLEENVVLAAGHRRTRRPFAALLQHDRGPERDRARQLLDRVGIGAAAEARPAAQPLGVLKRLEMARALALDPKVLLLDEPLAGLNHLEAARLADLIRDLNREGLSIVLIEHNLAEVLRISDRLFVLDNGRAIAEGPPAEVIADARVRAAYLGQGGDHAAA